MGRTRHRLSPWRTLPRRDPKRTVPGSSPRIRSLPSATYSRSGQGNGLRDVASSHCSHRSKPCALTRSLSLQLS